MFSSLPEQQSNHYEERISPGSSVDQLKFNRYSSASLDSGRGSDSIKVCLRDNPFRELISFVCAISVSFHHHNRIESQCIAVNQLAPLQATKIRKLLSNHPHFHLPHRRLPPSVPHPHRPLHPRIRISSITIGNCPPLRVAATHMSTVLRQPEWPITTVVFTANASLSVWLQIQTLQTKIATVGAHHLVS